MNWRELMKIKSSTQNPQNPQKGTHKSVFEDIGNKNKTKAMGFGCGRCSCKTYIQVAYGWQCEGCGAIFPIIGGSRGPIPTQ